MKKITILTIFILIVAFSCKTGGDAVKGNSSDTTKTNKNSSEKTTNDKSADSNSAGTDNSEKDKRFYFTITEKTTNDELDKNIRELFNAIEEKIATGNFDGWYNALSYIYKKHISDKAVLLTMSRESDQLNNRRITLETPKDYFVNVVVPSRKGMSLKYKNYTFIDKTHIKVNCVLEENISFFYDFVYEDNSWKVDMK